MLARPSARLAASSTSQQSKRDPASSQEKYIRERAKEYEDIVRAYQRRDDGAVGRMLRYWQADEPAKREIWPYLDLAIVPAAIVLHCHIALNAFVADENDLRAVHLALAETLAQYPPVERSARVERHGFYVIAGWMYAASPSSPLFVRHLQRAFDLFPGDPELSLMEASARDAAVSRFYAWPRTKVPEGYTADRRAAGAAGAWATRVRQDAVIVERYERATRAESPETAIEARMRLACVHLRASRLGKAREELDRVFAALTALDDVRRLRLRSIEHLAHLVSAQLASERKDWPAAVRDYRAAAVLCPAALAPAMGLAYVSVLAGNEQDARQAVATQLARSSSSAAQADRCGGDPWTRYGLGQGWRLDMLLSDLRARVRR